jgi:hypothetical protein
MTSDVKLWQLHINIQSKFVILIYTDLSIYNKTVLELIS